MSVAVPSFFALPSVVGLTASKVVATNASNHLVSLPTTGNGAVALATNPSFENITLKDAISGGITLSASSGVLLDISGNVRVPSNNWYYGRNANNESQPLIRSRGLGYNVLLYPGVQVGQTGDHIGLFIDPESIAGGSFGGTLNELLIPNTIRVLQANSAGTDWLYPVISIVNGNVGLGRSPDHRLDVDGVTRTQYLYINFTDPLINFYETDAGPDQKQWEIRQQSGVITWRFINDAYSLSEAFLQFNRNTGTYTTKSIVYPHGKIGIGLEPTAALHLKAGTATASTAPLKFSSGVSLTVPEAGAVEFDGMDLFFTPSSTRYKLARIPTSSPSYTTSHVTEDRTIDVNSTTLNELANFVCTLIADLKLTNIIQ